jgi:hypothetical protein
MVTKLAGVSYEINYEIQEQKFGLNFNGSQHDEIDAKNTSGKNSFFTKKTCVI